MLSLAEIRAYKTYLVGDLYSGLRGEQTLDQAYIDDTFPVPDVKEPHFVLRSGYGYKIVSSAAEQLVSSNPQVFVYPLKDIATTNQSARKISKELGDVWITSLKRQVPNLFKELIKNQIGRGESYIRLSHSEAWVTGKRLRYGLPVIFSSPDPMVVYASPADDDNGWMPRIGIPNRVVVAYPRQPLEVLSKYPSWSNPKKRGNGDSKNKLAEWWEYWDKDARYFEADGEPVLKGQIQPNDYGFTPFIRKFSGFGKESPDGDLSDMAVSDIRKSRDLIKELAVINSDIASILHIFAHKPVTIILPTGEEINESEIMHNFDLGSYALNLLYLPNGSQIHWGDTIIPGPEMFRYYQDKVSELFQRYPFLNAGFPLGGSGRQQDLSQTAGLKRYESVMENTEDQCSTAMEMALAVCKKIPKLLPDSLSKEDISIDFRCQVILKANDQLESDRKATLGSRLYQQSEIDLYTNLTRYQGYSQQEAEQIMTSILVEMVTFRNPEIAQVLGMKAAEKAGLLDEIREAQASLKTEQRNTRALMKTPMPAEMNQRRGEVGTEMGREMIDQALTNLGQRSAPNRYFREASV